MDVKKKKWWRPNKQYLFANKHIFVGMEICAFALAAVLANAVCLTTQLREKETQLSNMAPWTLPTSGHSFWANTTCLIGIIKCVFTGLALLSTYREPHEAETVGLRQK